MKKLRIGVFMGGKSAECEVSFNSGRTICDHLDTECYEVIPIFQTRKGLLYILPWHFLHRGKISDFEDRLQEEATKLLWSTLKNHVDFVYIAAHGRFSEDGTLQGVLEVLNIPYLGSKVFASALCMDKPMQKKILSSYNIATPHGIVLYPHDINIYAQDLEKYTEILKENNLALPCIVKPATSGSSLGVTVVKTIDQLPLALNQAMNVEDHERQAVVIEEYITGMEFTSIILTDYTNGKLYALPPTEIVPEQDTTFFDYKQKYMPGHATKHTPARCTPKTIKAIQDTSIKVAKALNMTTIARIDGFVTKDHRIIITDPNTLAGMAPSSFVFRQAAEAGMNHTAFINHLIKTELHNYSMNTSQTILKNQNNTIEKIKIGVIFGGASNEKEISLESGRNVLYKLSPEKYEAAPLFLDNNLNLYKITEQLLVRNSTKEITLGLDKCQSLTWDALPELVDFIFIALHGDIGENGCIQSMLEMLNIPYNGSSILTSALCIDKYKANRFLKTQGFNVPQHILVNLDSNIDNLSTNPNSNLSLELNNLNFPLIVKPHDDGCSFFVQKVKNQSELINALKTLKNNNKAYALIEEFIEGIELTVGVVGNNIPYALCPSKVVLADEVLSIEEKFLPGAGENQTPAPLPSQSLDLIRATISSGYKALGCKGYARIDCFYQNARQSPTGTERVIFLEVNTLPGLTPATCIFHQAAEAGLKPMEFIDLIIELGFEEHKHDYKTSFTKSISNLLPYKI